MKYKVKYDKSNLFLMSSIIVMCGIMCILFLVLKEYVYFFIYLVLTFLLAYIYYFTSYILDKKALVVKLGFIPVKIKYEFIWKVQEETKGVKITTKNFPLTIYPLEKQQFIKELNLKIDKSLNVKR